MKGSVNHCTLYHQPERQSWNCRWKVSSEAFLKLFSANPVTFKFIIQTQRSSYVTLSRCEVFALCTLLKVYLENCVLPLCHRLLRVLQWTARPSQDFLLCTSLTEHPRFTGQDGAADHKHSQPRFLQLLFACRRTQNKTSIQCNLARYELTTTYRTLSYCIWHYMIFSFYTGRLEVITYKSTLLERIFRELSESKIHRIKMNLSVMTVCFGMRLFLHRHARPASRSLLPSSYLC